MVKKFNFFGQKFTVTGRSRLAWNYDYALKMTVVREKFYFAPEEKNLLAIYLTHAKFSILKKR